MVARRDHNSSKSLSRKRGGTVAEKIMVVDDEPSIRGLLNDLLEEEGYEVILASDGKLPRDV